MFGGVAGPPMAPFVARRGLDTVVYGPSGKLITHQVDEFVQVAEIIQDAEVFAHGDLVFLGS